eukprot:6176883-Pleurochrysis_carterae.AAC.4
MTFFTYNGPDTNKWKVQYQYIIAPKGILYCAMRIALLRGQGTTDCGSVEARAGTNSRQHFSFENRLTSRPNSASVMQFPVRKFRHNTYYIIAIVVRSVAARSPKDSIKTARSLVIGWLETSQVVTSGPAIFKRLETILRLIAVHAGTGLGLETPVGQCYVLSLSFLRVFKHAE